MGYFYEGGIVIRGDDFMEGSLGVPSNINVEKTVTVKIPPWMILPIIIAIVVLYLILKK